MDIASAYLSILVHPADAGKTVFYTPRALYEINVIRLESWSSVFSSSQKERSGSGKFGIILFLLDHRFKLRFTKSHRYQNTASPQGVQEVFSLSRRLQERIGYRIRMEYVVADELSREPENSVDTEITKDNSKEKIFSAEEHENHFQK